MRSLTSSVLFLSLSSACAFDGGTAHDPEVVSPSGKGDDLGESAGSYDGSDQVWSDLLPVGAGTALYAAAEGCGPINVAELAQIDETRAAIRLQWGPNASDWYLGNTGLESQLWVLESVGTPGLVDGAQIALTATLTGEGDAAFPLELVGTVRARTDSDLVEIDFPGAAMAIWKESDTDFTVTFTAAAPVAIALRGQDVYNWCGNQEDGSIKKVFRYSIQ